MPRIKIKFRKDGPLFFAEIRVYGEPPFRIASFWPSVDAKILAHETAAKINRERFGGTAEIEVISVRS